MFGSSCGFVLFSDIAIGNQKLQISVQQLWDIGVVPDIWAKWNASERHMAIKSKKDKMLFGPILSLQIGSKHCLWPKPLAHLGNRPFALCVGEKGKYLLPVLWKTLLTMPVDKYIWITSFGGSWKPISKTRSLWANQITGSFWGLIMN